LSECIDQLESELSARRAQAFPIDLFGRKPLAPWTNPTANIPDALTAFHREKAATSSETQRLVALF